MPTSNEPNSSAGTGGPVKHTPGSSAGASPVPAGGASAGSQGRTDSQPHYTPVPSAKKYKSVGDYDIVSKLGQGAMGSVYLAKQRSTGQMVALKILPPDLAKDTELLERFKREARSSQRFSHPNIVSAVEFGTVDKYHYIAMEYVDGPDLETMLKKSGIFREELLLRCAAEMGLALEEIERHGIVHRDFKPSNIMMTSTGVFRLTDLGLASAGKGDQRLTLAGFAVGTPFYLSPEQAKGQLDVDIRADIYGLGATMYHLATGSVPFPGTNPVVVMTQHISAPLKPPEELEPSITPHVSALIQKMMEKEPADRPQNAAELRQMVAQCQSGQMPGSSGKTKSPKTRMERTLEGGGGIFDSVFGFIPQSIRLVTVIAMLVLACGALLATIYLLLKH